MVCHDWDCSFFILTQALPFYFVKGFIIHELDGGARFLVPGCPLIEIYLGIVLFIQLMLHGHWEHCFTVIAGITVKFLGEVCHLYY
jgi:hypothetical protein